MVAKGMCNNNPVAIETINKEKKGLIFFMIKTSNKTILINTMNKGIAVIIMNNKNFVSVRTP